MARPGEGAEGGVAHAPLRRPAGCERRGRIGDVERRQPPEGPEGVDEAQVRKTLLSEFGLEIGAGLGPLAGKIWRFGLMGYSCRPDNVMLCLSALGSVLDDMGYPVHVGDAEAAAHGAYAAMHAKEAQAKKGVKAKAA